MGTKGASAPEAVSTSSLGSLPPWTPAVSLRRCAGAVDRWLDRTLVGRWWSMRATAIAAVVGMFLAAPPFGGFADPAIPLWQYAFANSGPQLFDPAVDVQGQTGNLTFRVVPRLFGAALGLDQQWQFYVLQVVAGLVFLWAACEVFERALRSRRLAALLTVATATTWAGATGWLETRGLFDAFGLAFLALAMRARRWPSVFVFALAASFSDERAAIALPLVVCWHAWSSAPGGEPDLAADGAEVVEAEVGPRLRSLLRPAGLAVAGAVLAHLVIRTWLKHRYDLPEGHNRYPDNPFTQLRNYPNGLWTAFEGLWLVVVCGLWAWFREGRRLVAALVAGLGAVSLLVGMSVVDVTRAVAFAWPLAPVSLLGVRGLPPAFVRRLVWVAVAVCAVSPMVYAAGDQTVDWFYPALFVGPKVVLEWVR